MMKRIHDSLQGVFLRHRIVFWYDPQGGLADTFDDFAADGVIKLKVAGNEFGTKVRVVREPNPATRFLIYVPTERPPDAGNWLLDLLLQGYEYKADKASLDVQEAGLRQEFAFLGEEHAEFFRNKKHIHALRDRVDKDDQARDVRLKMMAVLANTSADVDALLLHFLSTDAGAELVDPIAVCYDGAALTEYFWREVERHFAYRSDAPSVRDFVVALFRAANPLDPSVTLHPHAKVFLQRWKDSQASSGAFRQWSRQMEKELQVQAAADDLDDRATLGDWDTFEVFDKFTMYRLCRSFEKGATAGDLREVIQQRRSSFWWPEYQAGYAAVEHAVELRELLAGAELAVESLSAGLSRYVGSWWRIDRAYRLCMLNLRRFNNEKVMAWITQWVDKTYVNNFLLPLTDRWSDQVQPLATWECDGLRSQRRFFESYVQPFRERGQKVFVIVSDALRFEAAADFAQRLQSANRWTAEVDAVFGSLPSYTQLGMAALLPGRQLAIDPVTATATVDGRSASGIANRAEILRQACDSRGTAIQAEEFLELNSKTDGRALMRDHDVIYIFHNHIDKVGDSLTTEAKTLEAVEQAFDELERIIRKVAAVNGSNMLITADHGFLFQQDDVSDGDMMTLPSAQELTKTNRRFVLGRSIQATPSVKVFDAEALKLEGDWSAAFPLSLGRFPLQGSGKRFVHGGTSLQEVVVPVVKVHKARADDTERVEVDGLRVPAKITTGQVSISLFQDQPAIEKVLPRTLRVGVFAKDGTPLSDIKTQTFDSKDAEARQRETTMLLVLSNAADAYNNKEVAIRLVETVPGTNQEVIYKSYDLKLQKPFTSDFDDL